MKLGILSKFNYAARRTANIGIGAAQMTAGGGIFSLGSLGMVSIAAICMSNPITLTLSMVGLGGTIFGGAYLMDRGAKNLFKKPKTSLPGPGVTKGEKGAGAAYSGGVPGSKFVPPPQQKQFMDDKPWFTPSQDTQQGQGPFNPTQPGSANNPFPMPFVPGQGGPGF